MPTLSGWLTFLEAFATFLASLFALRLSLIGWHHLNTKLSATSQESRVGSSGVAGGSVTSTHGGLFSSEWSARAGSAPTRSPKSTNEISPHHNAIPSPNKPSTLNRLLTGHTNLIATKSTICSVISCQKSASNRPVHIHTP